MGRRPCAAHRIRLDDVATRAGRQRRFGHVPRAMLADEQDSCVGIVLENPVSGLDAVERGKADVEQDEIRSKRRGLLHGIRAVRHFSDDLPSRVLKRRADVATPRLIVIDDEHATDRGVRIQDDRQKGQPKPAF